MRRSAAAYLSDILEACAAIEEVLSGVDLSTYEGARSMRSSVERELITIGEAVSVLGRVARRASGTVARHKRRGQR